MRVMDDDDGIVCRVLPDGSMICEKVPDTSPIEGAVAMISKAPVETQSVPSSLIDALPPGEWGPNKVRLAVAMLETLGQSSLPDERIPRRSGEIVASIQQLLAPLPPSMLLYNYSTQPANVMGAYYLNTGDVVRMQQVFKIFEHPKTP